MPVSFTVAQHPAKSRKWYGRKHETAEDILEFACREPASKVERIVQFSISGMEIPSELDATKPNPYVVQPIPTVLPNPNGFMNTVIVAYNDHHTLVLRPDDVWMAILAQFNFFVNANAESLRAAFVAHQDKIELVVQDERDDIHDFGNMARMMTDAIDKNVADPTLRQWALPDFTTTTAHDVTVGAVLLMATLKTYFKYTMLCGGCGYPSVQLLGSKDDWMQILARIEKLKEYGLETTAWYHLLRPVISRIVRAFDAPQSAANVDFWGKTVHYHSIMSGYAYYTGWINAFNAFSKHGKWLGHKLNADAIPTKGRAAEDLSAAEFWETYLARDQDVARDLVLDDTPYHQLSFNAVPPAFAEVDVAVRFTENGPQEDCVMVAGTLGTRISSSGEKNKQLSETGEDDVMRPMSGWYLFTKRTDMEKPGESWGPRPRMKRQAPPVYL
ncbi:hypothetical protein MKEN_01339800 [Mycena kentingensis (nom. inval.)]|nr:hypothetical protein MKEN_01339800 [Mycena kentingensis (nom. inval.)]